jgi:hypothetical protein
MITRKQICITGATGLIETELNFQLTKKMPFGIIELIGSTPTPQLP